MSQTQMWLLIIIVGLVTYGFRLSFIFLSGRGTEDVSPVLDRILVLIPAAVLAAMIAPEILLLKSTATFSWANERLWAGLIGLVVAWRTSNLFTTVAVGMVALWVLQWLMG